MRQKILITTILINIILVGCAPSTQKYPPLVLEPNKYSYTFAIPEGWDFSFEQAQQFSVRLVFFPKGGNIHESNSIVYINEICLANCNGTLSSAIQTTIDNAKKQSPNLQVAYSNPIKISVGGEAPVLIFTGSKDPRQAQEALAFIEHSEAVILVVLTTKDVKNWDQDYKAFEQIVAGHKFFNCSSPNLAVPCR